VCVSIDSMLLDVFARYVGDLRVVRKSKKIQMYSDRFKSLVECCDDVYACEVCGDMLCVMNIYIYTGMST